MTRLDWMGSALCAGRSEWTDHADRAEAKAAREACTRCPVIGPCAEWASQHRWSGVVVAGWLAPSVEPKRHPGRDPPPHTQTTRPDRQSTKTGDPHMSTTDTTPKPAVVAIESDSPTYSDDFLRSAAEVDETWSQQVPDHLRETYLSIAVPEDVIRSAVAGKTQTIELVQIDPMETDKATYDKLRSQAAPRTPTVREALHDWRLQEAARLHADEQRKQELGYYAVSCPACSARVYQASLGALDLPGGRFVGCPPCFDALRAEQQRLADLADPTLQARRKAVATALGQEHAS